MLRGMSYSTTPHRRLDCAPDSRCVKLAFTALVVCANNAAPALEACGELKKAPTSPPVPASVTPGTTACPGRRAPLSLSVAPQTCFVYVCGWGGGFLVCARVFALLTWLCAQPQGTGTPKTISAGSYGEGGTNTTRQNRAACVRPVCATPIVLCCVAGANVHTVAADRWVVLPRRHPHAVCTRHVLVKQCVNVFVVFWRLLLHGWVPRPPAV